MSAASLATSVAASTEMPTSAWWRASASLTPSPRNATADPARAGRRTMRAFCSGLTRAKIVVSSTACGECRRRRARRGRRRSASRPSGMPSVAADRLGDEGVVAGDDLDRDTELGEAGDATRPPTASVGRGRPGTRRGAGRARPCRVTQLSSGASREATATTRLPALNSAVEHPAGCVGDVGAAVEDGLRGALGDEQRGRRSSTSTETQRRSWSNGERWRRRSNVGDGRRSPQPAPPTGRRRAGCRHRRAAAHGGLVAYQPEA